MYPIDAALRGLVDRDAEHVASACDRRRCAIVSVKSLRQGGVSTTMHWTGQDSRDGPVNAAAHTAVHPASGQRELKHTPVQVERVDLRWHGTIIAHRPIMLPQIAYWTHIRGAGFHAYLLAGEEDVAATQHVLSAALRSGNPGPWIEGKVGSSAVIADGRVEAILSLNEKLDEAARDRLSPFLQNGRLTVDERTALLSGGVADANTAERGGEVCACFGVSCGAVEAAIGKGAGTLDAVGAVTKAGINCGSYRPEIRALLRAARTRKAA